MNKNIKVLCENIEYVLRRGFNKKNRLSILSYLRLGNNANDCQKAIYFITEEDEFTNCLMQIFLEQENDFEPELKQFISKYIYS